MEITDKTSRTFYLNIIEVVDSLSHKSIQMSHPLNGSHDGK